MKNQPEGKECRNGSISKKGAFIVFEGIDGSGKSTQIQLLSDRLRKEKIPFYATMEPTDSPIGCLIHQVMTGRVKMDNKAVAALFAADRLDHLLNDVNGIIHKIEAGTTVLMDRYYISSYAYQSVEAPMDWVIQANGQSSALLRPSVNIFLDIDPDTALERIAKSRFEKELYEEKKRLVQVRQNYMEAFAKLERDERTAVINGNRHPKEIAEEVWQIVRHMIQACYSPDTQA